MRKLQQVKIEEDKEKITLNHQRRSFFERKKSSKENNSFSIKLFFVRCMILSMFFTFCFLVYKLNFKKSLLEINIYKSHRLINKQNIHKINNLNISLNIEHSNFVHLKITDRDNKRWEVPKEILNPEYFTNLNNNNTNNININETLFNLEIIGDKNNFNYNTNNFGFNLYFFDKEKNQKNIFYSFNTNKNFLYSDNFISFESHLTSDDIYGFGERIHEFKLEEGIYTIWPVDRPNFYDDGKGSKNLYGHQPIGLHRTKYKQIWMGFVFLNSNAQDVQIHKNSFQHKTILSHKTIGGVIDYYIIVDNSPENVIKDIHFLLGKPILPPYWALGMHQCRWGYKNTYEFEQVFDNYINKKIPIDAMWIDIDAMNNYEIFTLNKNNFKNLPNIITNKIHKNNSKFIPII